MSVLQALANAKEANDPQSLLPYFPYANAIGISASLSEGQLVAQLAFDQHIIGDLGAAALQGGAISTLLESVAVLAIVWEIDKIQMPQLMNHSVEYLSSGRPKPTFARAEITRHGHQIANVRTIAWQDDPSTPIAAAHSHVLLHPMAK
jgi:acyl-coenzyme A thioesterase PaaI-like protein